MTMQDNFDSNEERERLERLLSHPESAEVVADAMAKALVQGQQAKPEDESVQEVQQQLPESNDLVININRHFMISGGLLVGVLMLAAAVATPLRDTYDVCFNPNPVPNTSKCLGVKTYTIDQDRVEKLVNHPGLVVAFKSKGNPVLAVGLALFGTAFATGSGFVAKQTLKEKSEALPVSRTNRRTAWTAQKLEADKVIKQRHQDLQHGFDVSDNTNQHALAASDTLNEFEQLQLLIAKLDDNQRELFFQHLALKEQKEMLQQQAQLQAQQAQSPFAALLGGLPQQQLVGGTNASALSDEIEKAKEAGQSIIKTAAASIKSKVLVAPSRAGKTTVLYLYYEAMFNRYPNAEVFVVEDKREMVHPRIPALSYAFCDGENFKDAGLEMLGRVYDIYTERARMAESERDAIAAKHPIRLALIDWLATWTAVKKDKAIADEVNSKLIGIITKGAGCGVCVDIDTHSSNVEALGVDESTRESLDFISIAYCKQDDRGDLDRIADSLGLLPKVIGKSLIVPDRDERKRLQSEFTKLRDGLLNNQFNSSIIFTTTGGNRIGITPQFERKTLGDLMIDADEEVEEELTEADEENNIDYYLIDAAKIIKLYLESREDKQASFKAIRDQRALRKLWREPGKLAKLAIDFLISKEIVVLVDEVDPVLGTKADAPQDKKIYRLRK